MRSSRTIPIQEELMRKYLISVSLLIGGLAAFNVTAHAADKSAKTVPAMAPEQAAMMQKAMPYMTPGVEHKALDPMVGKWDAKVTMWMKPGDSPQVSAGKAENA